MTGDPRPLEIHRRPAAEVLTDALDQLAAVLDPLLAGLPPAQIAPVLGPLLTAATAAGRLRADAERPGLLCAFCLFTREHGEPAVTVLNGQAVCDEHNGYAQGGEHAHALIRVRHHDEQREAPT